MGNHMDFQRGVTDYQSGQPMQQDQGQPYENGYQIARLEAQHTALVAAARAYLNSDTPDPRDQDQVDECEITRDALAALIGESE